MLRICCPKTSKVRLEGENNMDRVCASGLVCLIVVLGLACSTSQPGSESRCPPPNDIIAIDLGCLPGEEPGVKTTGPCSLTSGGDPQSVYLQTNGAGTCHVELTFGRGATPSVDVNIVARWRSLGSDPHGCGQEFVGVTDTGAPCLPSACKFALPGRKCDERQ